MHLPDINFWLALAFQGHQHHSLAKAWLETAPQKSCLFCRMTQQGFQRLATNQQISPFAGVSMRDAWKLYDLLYVDVRVGFVDEPDHTEVTWRKLTQSSLPSTKLWSDAYLAALALTADYEIVTFDKGFVQYPNLKRTILS